MITSIQNGNISISVRNTGAELASLKTLNDGVELLWQGDEKYWGKQSPLLFPIIGGIPDGKYQLDESFYTMSQHGFARQSDFELVEQSQDSICYRLGFDSKTLAGYPFKFELFVKYILDGNVLRVIFKVRNLDEKTMFFSIGAHPGFKCPIFDNEKMSDYMLVFERPETVKRRFKVGTLLSGEMEAFLENSNLVNLSHNLFNKGAIIIDSFRSDWVELRNNVNSKVIRMEFKGFPYLGIWSANNEGPFVCIEPWYGIDSTLGDSYDITKKEGILGLDSSETFECEYRIIAK